MRTLAVYLVVAFHAGWKLVGNGFVGVDLFFVLSGFLVTNVLMDDVARRGRVDLPRFYSRRVRRLLPAAAVVIVSVAFLYLAIAPVTQRLDIVGDARAAALYVANWHFIREATDYFAADGQPSPYLHFWSLAIEEQFYLVFPLMVAGLATLQRRRRGAIAIGLTVLALGGVVVQLSWGLVDDVRAYYGTDARLYQLLAGASLAALLRQARTAADRRGTELPATPRTAGVGAVLLVLLATPLLGVSASLRGVFVTIAALLLILGLEVRAGRATHAVLIRPNMVRLGRISYGTYLWHWPIILGLERLVDLGGFAMFVVAGALSTGLAALSAMIIEDPIRRSRALEIRPRRIVASGLAVSVVVAIVAGGLLRSDATPLLVRSDQVVTAADVESYGPVPSDVDWNDVRQGDLEPYPECTIGSLEACTTVTGERERILLVGDSHAGMIFPALEQLARDSNATFMALIKSACTWIDGLQRREDSVEDRCQEQRDGWSTDLVAALKPTQVILVQRDPGMLLDEYILPDGVDPKAEVERLTRVTLQNLADAGAEVIVLHPNPEAPTDPIDCMAASTSVASCLWDADQADQWARDATRRAADGIPGVRLETIDRIACPELPTCSPYLDDEWVMRDEHHIQPSWWLLHLDDLRAVFDPLFTIRS